MATKNLTQTEVLEAVETLAKHDEAGIRSLRFDAFVGNEEKEVSWRRETLSTEWILY